VVTPLNVLVLRLSWEFKNLFTCFEVGDDGSVIFSGTDDQTWIGKAPVEGKNTAVVDIMVCLNWIIWITKIPDVD
jgi:hypothetical protein